MPRFTIIAQEVQKYSFQNKEWFWRRTSDFDIHVDVFDVLAFENRHEHDDLLVCWTFLNTALVLNNCTINSTPLCRRGGGIWGTSLRLCRSMFEVSVGLQTLPNVCCKMSQHYLEKFHATKMKTFDIHPNHCNTHL